MLSIYALKPKFQALLRPLADAFYRAGITANMVTLFAMFASIAYGAWMYFSPHQKLPFLLLPLFMFARMALNAIDGLLARQYQQQSKLGAMLNEVGDVVSDAALFAPFALLTGVSVALLMLVIFLALLAEFVGVVSQTIGGERRYDGPLGKSDRACWIRSRQPQCGRVRSPDRRSVWAVSFRRSAVRPVGTKRYIADV